ncbi:hypothetical protein ACFX5U_03325 [Sphingobacterium sp. SG20118]|uniref:hypothetical protein n=1 Tax=Sphingobacterium sp. SG20118 TaxID=3367156 RepID=UPI0037DFC5C2
MRNQYLLALLSAFLLWLGWPPVPYSSPILLIAFLPLLIAIENIIRSDSFTKKGKKVFLTAGLTAVIWKHRIYLLGLQLHLGSNALVYRNFHFTHTLLIGSIVNGNCISPILPDA